MINGDHELDAGGYPRAVYGEDERRQRAAFILSVRKGAFKYNRALGMDHGELLNSDVKERALVLCREALAGRGDINISDISLDCSAFHPKLVFSLRSSPETTAEVIIYQNI